MGRSTYKFNPGFYFFAPIPPRTDAGASNVQWTQSIFLPTLRDQGRTNENPPHPMSMHRVDASAVQTVNASASMLLELFDVPAGGTYGGTSKCAAGHRIRPSVSNDWTGRFLPQNSASDAGTVSVDPGIGYFERSSAGLMTANPGLTLKGNVTTTDNWIGLAGVATLSADGWTTLQAGGLWGDHGQTTPPLTEIPGTGAAPTHMGPTYGGLTIWPIPLVKSHTGTGNVRAVTAPCDMRVHAIMFSCAARATDTGTVRVRNLTQSTTITGTVSFPTSASWQYKVINAEGTGDGTFVPTHATRTIRRNDLILLESFSGAGAYTDLSAYMIVNTLSHPNEKELYRDWLSTNDPEMTPRAGAGREAGHAGLSGPALGGFAYWPFQGMVLAANQAETKLAELPAPFDCVVLGAYFTCSDTGTYYVTGRVHNATTTTDIATGIDLYYGYNYEWQDNAVGTGFGFADWQGIGDERPSPPAAPAITARTVTRGDIIEIYVATPLTSAFTDGNAGLIVIPTGFPHDNAALD